MYNYLNIIKNNYMLRQLEEIVDSAYKAAWNNNKKKGRHLMAIYF